MKMKQSRNSMQDDLIHEADPKFLTQNPMQFSSANVQVP